MYKNIPPKPNRVSIFGLYAEFRDLRAGYQRLLHLGFGVRDVSFLIPEAALSPASVAAVCEGGFQSSTLFSGSIIAGTLESLNHLHPRDIGVIAGAILSVGIPSYEAEEYESAIREGKVLLCARSFSYALGDLAMQTLLHTGAERIISVPLPSAQSQAVARKEFCWTGVTPTFERNLVC